MNITHEAIDIEIANIQRIIRSYELNKDYVNPNISLGKAKELLKDLQKEYYIKNRKI